MFGNRVERLTDVGVAGLHRLLERADVQIGRATSELQSRAMISYGVFCLKTTNTFHELVFRLILEKTTLKQFKTVLTLTA